MKTKPTKPPARKRTAKPNATKRSDTQPPDAAQPDAPPVVDPPAMRIEQWAVARLKPYERNPRTNDGEPVAKMIASIKEFGFAVPVLAQASDGLVIDGHLRLKAAVAMGLASVPVIPCDGWSEAQVRAFRIMVNRSVSWSEFDPEALALEFAELKALEFDLTLTGFDQKELVSFMAGTANAAEDDVPDVPETPVSRTGDLWLLGGHRLLVGDSTNAADVERLMAGAKAGLMNTDPPYGIGYDSAELHEHGVSYAKIEGDHHEDEALQAFLEVAFSCALTALKPNAGWYLWHAMLTQGFFAAAAAAAHVILHRQIIWVKPVLVFGRGQYHWKHELCFMGWVKGNEPPNLTGFTDTTVWEVDGVSQAERTEFNHSTPKPVELFRRPILKHLEAGEICYEPFAGSGPQFVAAELTERICYGLEIAPAFCDVIVARWQTLTSRDATLETDGRTFAAVAAERLKPAKRKKAAV